MNNDFITDTATALGMLPQGQGAAEIVNILKKNGNGQGLPPLVIGAIISSLASIVGGIINGKMNKNATEQLQDQAWQRNEQSANNADVRTRQLFNDLYSPKAKVQQLKDAGLGVGLMYGGGAVGGTSSTSGAQATSTPASFNGYDVLGILPQMIMAISQSKLNEAKTKESEAKTDEITANTENIKQAGKLLVEQIHNEHLKGIAQGLTNDILAIDKEIREKTKDMDIQKIEWDTKVAGYKLQEILLKCAGDEVAIAQSIQMFDILFARESIGAIMDAEELDQFQKSKTWVLQALKYKALGDKEAYNQLFSENNGLPEQLKKLAGETEGAKGWLYRSLAYLAEIGSHMSFSVHN